MLSVLLSIAIAVPLPASPSAAGEAFVRALVAGDLAALRSLGDVRTDFLDAVDLLERLDCISIAHHDVKVVRVADGAAELSLFLDGTAFTNGAIRREVRLPSHWRLEVAAETSGWRIRSLQSEERALSIELTFATDDQRERVLAEHPGLDLDFFLRHLSANAANATHATNDGGSMAFASGFAGTLGNPKTEQYVLRMAALRESYHDADHSIAMASEALAAARRLGDPDEIASALFRLGILCWITGRIDEGARLLNESASYADAVAEPRVALRALHMYGFIRTRQGQLREVFNAAERLGKLSGKWGWQEGVIDAEIGKGVAHLELGDAEGGRSYSMKAFELAQRANDPRTASYALFNAVAFNPAETTEDAVLQVRRAISWVRESEGPTTVAMQGQLALMLMSLGHWDEAEELMRNSDGSFPRSPEVLLPRATLRIHQGRYEEALADVREFERPAKLQGGNGGRETPWESHTIAARAFLGLRREAEAVAELETAIALIEERRAEVMTDSAARSSFLADKVEPFQRLMDLDLAQGRAREALLVGERLRARTLQELLAQGRVDVSKSMSGEEKAEEARLETKVIERNRELLAAMRDEGDDAELRGRLEQARSALSRFRTELVLQHPDVRMLRGTTTPMEIERLDTLLTRDDDAVLVYSVHPAESHLFVLRRGVTGVSVDVHDIPVGRKELAARVERFVAGLERRDLGYGAEARALYGLLIAPAEKALAGRRVLCIVPDGPLWHLPFQVLQRSSGEHLVERTAVFFAPSLSALRRAPQSPKAPALLALGNATASSGRPAFYRGGALDALPDAEREVRAIGALYGEASRVLVRGNARESAVKELAPSAQVLHFATHAVIDDASPLYSSLVLAGSKSEDGLLEAREILDLPLHAEVAVLSACETARGSVRAGEGMVGMSWALMAAGCPTSVVSEWKVPSSSTSVLMVEFHRQLLRLRGTEGATAEALRRAQVSFLRGSNRHPFYWSAFVVIANEW